MKTAATIEEQESRKDARDNDSQRDSSPELRAPVRPKSKHRDASRIAAWRFKPGQRGNPGGVPKHDVAKEIAQAIFLNNAEMIYAAYCKMLGKGNAYAFQVLSDRAFGELKEHVEIDRGPYGYLSDEELKQRIADLEEKLGVPRSEPEILPPISGDSNPN